MRATRVWHGSMPNLLCLFKGARLFWSRRSFHQGNWQSRRHLRPSSVAGRTTQTKSYLLLCNPLWIMQGERKQHGQLQNRVRVFGIAKRRMHLKVQRGPSSWQSVIQSMCLSVLFLIWSLSFHQWRLDFFSFSIYFMFTVVLSGVRIVIKVMLESTCSFHRDVILKRIQCKWSLEASVEMRSLQCIHMFCFKSGPQTYSTCAPSPLTNLYSLSSHE